MTLAARRGTPVSLSTRLIAVAVLMVVLISVIVGAVSVVTLHRSLAERVDAQLNSAFGRASDVVSERGVTSGLWLESELPRDATAVLRGPAQAPGTLALVARGAGLTGGYLGEDGEVLPVQPEHLRAIAQLPVDGSPSTMSLGPSLGDYRMQGAVVGDALVVIGLPLGDVQQTVRGLSWAIVGVAGVGMLALALLGSVLIRRALRPLERVAAAADTVAAQVLDRGDVAGLARVDGAGAADASEVGRVVTAVNSMMDNVERALTVREASEQRVRRFVADASHELRTPLASIRGYAELVRRIDGELNPDVGHSLGRIESESLRMQALVEDLLLLARLDEGQDLAREPVDLAGVVRAALGDAAVIGDGHTWALDVPDAAVPVLGDAARLHQVVANLLANARSHTPPGTTVLAAVRADPAAPGGPVARVTVSDDGPGIDERVRDRVFARFVRGDRSRARGEGSGGSGLGLSIVQALTEAHGGVAAVRSRPGETVFTLTFPLLDPACPGADAPEAA